MSTGTGIEWTDATWNPTAGCSIVSPGCSKCYAMRMAARLEAMGQKKYVGLTTKKNGHAVWTGKMNMDEELLSVPLGWKKPRRVFVNSMSDLFHKGVPFEFVDKVSAVMALTPRHTYQVLTKRPERMAEYLATRTAMDDSHRVDTLPQWYQAYTRWFDEGYGGGRFFQHERDWDRAHAAAETIDPTRPLKNVWLGVSIENQQTADARRESFRDCPAATKFVSYEPALGPVDWTGWEFIHQVISGGESGPGARPSHPDWHRATRDYCVERGIAYFFKQWGEWSPFSTTARYTKDSLMPGNDDEIGGDCGCPAGSYGEVKEEKDGRLTCNIGPYGRPEKRVELLEKTDHTWGKNDLQTMSYLRVGKKAAGRLLDGRTWDEFPTSAVANSSPSPIL